MIGSIILIVCGLLVMALAGIILLEPSPHNSDPIVWLVVFFLGVVMLISGAAP